MGRWHEDSRDYKITQCNTQTNIGSMKQPYELSSFISKYTCRNMVQKFEGWNWCIHVLYIQKRCISYLIIILNLVFFFYYNTNFITAYLFVFRWSGSIIQQKPCRILYNLCLITKGIIIIFHNLFKMRDVLWNYMTGKHS